MKTDGQAFRNLLHGPAPGWMAVCRGASLGVACLMLLNLLEVFVYATSPVMNWFVSLHPLTAPLGTTILAMTATALLMFAVRPSLPGPVQLTTIALILVWGGFLARELWQVSRTVSEAERTVAMAQPLGTTMLLAVMLPGILAGNAGFAQGRSSFIAILLSAAVTAVSYALAAIQTGGLSDSVTDEACSMIVVFACEENSDGEPTEATSDRIRTAGRLLIDERGKIILLAGQFSRRPGQPLTAFNSLAKELNIPESQLEAEPDGTDIVHTLDALLLRPEIQNEQCLIAVSHWFQLARIRLLARRVGLKVTVVAADQQHALLGQNMTVLEETWALLQAMWEPGVQFVKNTPRAAPAPATTDEDLDSSEDELSGIGSEAEPAENFEQ